MTALFQVENPIFHLKFLYTMNFAKNERKCISKNTQVPKSTFLWLWAISLNTLIVYWSGVMKWYLSTPSLWAEWWSGAERHFESGVKKGVNSKIKGAYPSLLRTGQDLLPVRLRGRVRPVQLFTRWKAYFRRIVRTIRYAIVIARGVDAW